MAENNNTKETIITAAIALLILWFIIDNIFGISRGRKEKDDAERKREEALKKDKEIEISSLAQLMQKGINPSYTSQEYGRLANRLYDAMNGAGTDNLAVMEVLGQIKNEADIIVLGGAFGIREGWNMLQWLRNDLGPVQATLANSKFSKLGINYRI